MHLKYKFLKFLCKIMGHKTPIDPNPELVSKFPYVICPRCGDDVR